MTSQTMPMYRDTWGLKPSFSRYPGAFPSGLVNRVKDRWWGRNRLWLFSGSYQDPHGTTVDIKPEIRDNRGVLIAIPDVVADCERLPFRDESFDFVCLDPPYSKDEARQLYDLPYYSIVRVMNEAARVCCPGGHVVLLHRLVPTVHNMDSPERKKLKMVAAVGVYISPGITSMRALSVWRKRGDLRTFLEEDYQ